VYAVGLAALLATNYINVMIPQYIQEAIDALERNSPHREVEVAALALAGLAAVVIVTRTLSRILFFNPGRTIEFRLKNQYFYHVMRLPLTAFQDWTSGDLISRGTNDMNYVRSVIGFATLQILNLTMALSLALYQMMMLDWRLTLSCALPLSIGLILLRQGIRKLLIRFREGQNQLSELSTTVINAYTGAAVIQSLQAEGTFDERVSSQNKAYVDTFLSMARLSAFALPLVQVAGSSCLAILLYFGGLRAAEGNLTVGEIAAYASYLGIVVTGLTSSGWMLNALQRGLASLNRVYDVLDLEEELPKRDNESMTGEVEPCSPIAVKAKGINFRFEASDTDAFSLENINFELKPGQTLGLFGPTGSGKSTLLSLIAGLHPITEGKLHLDDDSIETLEDIALRRKVAFVPQNAFLFSRTVRENVGFSSHRNSIEEERVSLALELACFTSDVDALGDGLDTVVGERGVTLSGGQRQRVALARAFYRDFGLLLLDDVLSAVDHNTERQLVENIHERTSSFTSIIASHRISAFRYAQEILVLENGRVTARGTHEELIQTPGPYKDAWLLEETQEDGHGR